MNRYLKIQNVSYKHRSVLVDNTWLKVSRDLELNDLEIDKAYDLDISQTLEGDWIINKINKGELYGSY